jgi:hypothetical protein
MMPRISSFYGVDIYMYYNEHVPHHFHAMHGEDEAIISFSPPQLYRGASPRKVLKDALPIGGIARRGTQ